MNQTFPLIALLLTLFTLEVASLLLGKPDFEATLFMGDGEGGDDINSIPIS